jgi:hypothetical protein
MLFRPARRRLPVLATSKPAFVHHDSATTIQPPLPQQLKRRSR